ncbi:uncharacterized protein LY89DRAFT_682824 [Mollisia scopiformis]|uniref:BZIP domain-containing protein n=1 Tax=Mollisia scopiformis TaxID=149040 RepID=A0A194XIS4_MOLSC|nr:uncharacterized protein LY89DRAFT_682824 [Mollisia scopiformis]KUJ20019.1 hypothetical protein LY89DRAFT_682824 [Mollisia scopiformis]
MHHLGKKSATGDGKEDGGTDKGDASNLTQKQRRRAQVRKAQIEHRQRKENYVKHLEQDVINLREMIAQAETESVLVKFENEGIKSVLKKANVNIPTSPPTAQSPPPPQQDDFDDFMDFTSFLAEPHQSDFGSSSNSPHDMLINTTFDEWIDSTILQISPTHSHSSSGTKTQVPVSVPETDIANMPNSYNSTDIYNFPTPFTNPQVSNTLPPTIAGVNANQAALANLNLDLKPLPQLPGPGQASSSQVTSKPSRVDVSTIAINFILALEHPCRTHFHPAPPVFNPTAPPGGHELMASTLLYATAPSTIYSPDSLSPTESATWTAPSLELKQLFEMSKSLPKGDWEITPVQAWFLLVERYGVRSLVREEGVLDRLKRGLGRLVDCFYFGAVMDRGRFWEFVEGELGPARGKEGKGKERA